MSMFCILFNHIKQHPYTPPTLKKLDRSIFIVHNINLDMVSLFLTFVSMFTSLIIICSHLLITLG